MFFRRLNWNVVGWFRIVSAISYAFIIAGLLFMGYHWLKDGSPLRLGLSFTGGTDVTVKFKQPVTKDAIASALATQKITDARINTLSKTGEPVGERWTIETQTDIGNNSVPFWSAMGAVAPVDRDASSISTVGPSLSHEYLFNAIKALVIAITIQFLYIAFRFGWNLIFGWVCVVALVRDSLMMIGIYAIAGRRVDDAFLAAVLTVIGYSVMDTIVILDRIRENVKLMDGKPFDEIVNTSILQTMTRSVNTLATVVITLIALITFGGGSLQNFAFALLVGICSGGYHSIFFSAPLVAVMQKRVSKRTGGGIFHRSSLAPQPKTVAAARGGAAGAIAAHHAPAALQAHAARADRLREAREPQLRRGAAAQAAARTRAADRRRRDRSARRAGDGAARRGRAARPRGDPPEPRRRRTARRRRDPPRPRQAGRPRAGTQDDPVT
jgi:preprotein translocase SecF subunit